MVLGGRATSWWSGVVGECGGGRWCWCVLGGVGCGWWVMRDGGGRWW